MASDIDLLNQIIDLKINAAVGAVLGEVQKVAQAHAGLSERVGPLLDEFNRRRAEEAKSKDEQIAALQKALAELAPKSASLVIPPAEAQG